MSAIFYTVAVPATATSLAALITALPNRPVITVAGRSTPFPAGRAAQLTLASDPANTGKIYYGGPTVTATGTGLNPGGSGNIGSASELSLDISNVYVISTTAGSVLGVTVID